jgi:carboxymethylenebutenolidase
MAVETNEQVPLGSGGSMRARLCRPDGAAPAGGWPGVVAIHDIMGFTPDIRRIARRFADSGYAALAPALYDGAGAPPLCVARTVRDMSRGDGPAFERLEHARRFLGAQPGVDPTRIGVTGFCMGGGFALYWAARGGLQVCAPFYGQVPEQAEDLRRVCPVVASFGELDQPFLEHGRRLEKHLAELGVPHDFKMYPGVGHAFMNDHGSGLMAALGRRTKMRAAHDPVAAEDAWGRMLRFFAEHL